MNAVIKKICKVQNIKVRSYEKSKKILETFNLENYANTVAGFCFEHKGKNQKTPVILYNDKLSDTEQEKVIAHEIGHILLGDVSCDGSFNKLKKVSEQYYSEFMADMFAAVLMALSTVAEYEKGESAK